jgi:hypothetical protein
MSVADPSWFYSSLSQVTAAIVGFLGGFLILRLLGHISDLLSIPLSRRRMVGLLLSLAAFTAACTGDEGSDAERAVEAVEGFDPGSSVSIDGLNQAVARGGDVIPALEPFLTDPDPARKWAALYVVALLANSDVDADAIVPVLEDPDPANQVIAAGSLCGLGRKAALPALIEGLAADAALPYTDPPRPVSDLAAEALEAYTGETFETQGEWEAWWDEVSAEIRWDGERYVAV